VVEIDMAKVKRRVELAIKEEYKSGLSTNMVVSEK
jgi:hypothetical protein